MNSFNPIPTSLTEEGLHLDNIDSSYQNLPLYIALFTRKLHMKIEIDNTQQPNSVLVSSNEDWILNLHEICIR